MRPHEAPPLVVVLGATATGKSALAIALARSLRGEVVGADAFQVYRGLDIGTGKVPPPEREGIPHHLVDCADPGDDYSLGRYVREAEAAIEAIRDRGHLPVVAGGTGMYLRGLLRGIFDGPGRDGAFRERLQAIVDRGGLGRLFVLLHRGDPVWADRVGPGDRQRILRGLEVLRKTGRPLSQQAREWESPDPRHPAVLIGLHLPRPALDRRIEERIDAMWDAGFVEEVRGLIARGVPEGCNAFRAIGYREVAGALRGEYPLEEARRRMLLATRRYAKRQRTWFRGEPGVTWLDATRPAAALLEEARNTFAGGCPRV